jgi:broad specificity phosphatase PhoE
MGWPKRLVLVRHAESKGNVLSADERAKCRYATYAFPLTKRGRRQAKLTGEYLKAEYDPFDIRYTSYYKRARQTMKILCPGEKFYRDSRLAEAQRGIWHTMTEKQIRRWAPHEFKRKAKENLYHYRPLGGENWSDVEDRIHSMLDTLNRDYEGLNVLMVVHAHWEILFQRIVAHSSIKDAMRRYRAGVIKNASVTEYEGRVVEGKSRLILVKENIAPWEGRI